MAEVLGIIASGFSVASLGIQLAEIVQKIHGFWDGFKEADASVERIKDHLALISIIASNIAETCREEPGVTCDNTVIKSLEACRIRMEQLWDQISESEHSLDRVTDIGAVKRNWLRFRHVLKEKTINKVENQLKGDVMMLLLALQPFFHQIQRYRIRSLASTMRELSIENRGQEKGTKNAIELPNSSLDRRSAYIKIPKNWTTELSKSKGRDISMRLDSCTAIEIVISTLGLSLPLWYRNILLRYLIGLSYTTLEQPMLTDGEDDYLKNVKRRLKLISPIISFQIQTSNLPRTLKYFPVIPCQSPIFNLCLEGHVGAVKAMLMSYKISPFVVNLHGENLLHAAARYAHADLCSFLLDIGVDGSAYDDRLLTPLDHLARKVPPTFDYPSRVVNTIRALVERGRCQPLLPVTSNSVAFYRGPEEGFAWLFASQYAGVDLEEQDSEGWTLLGDAAFNLGWWTQLDIEDPAVCWQIMYLLKAGADPHGISSENGLTPLDAFLRGCTASQEDHAGRWIEVLRECGLDLHEYARKEQRIHGNEQYVLVSWDAHLWKWFSTKRRVVYRYGETSQDLEIWLEDFDALSWFNCGRYDLEIFQVASPAQSLLRWKEIDAREVEHLECIKEINAAADVQLSKLSAQLKSTNAVLQAPWFRFLVVSLFFHYAFHLILLHSEYSIPYKGRQA